MVSTLLCKPPSIAGLSTTITKGSTQWYFWQFVMHTISMSVVVFFYLVHHQWSLSLSIQVYLD